MSGLPDRRDGRRTPIIQIELPYPPSANRYWRKTQTGRVYIGEDAKVYRKTVFALTIREPRLKGDVAIALKFYRPRKSGDLDNRIKVLFDALQINCIEDDSQVVEIHAYRFEDKKNPRVWVEITPL